MVLPSATCSRSLHCTRSFRYAGTRCHCLLRFGRVFELLKVSSLSCCSSLWRCQNHSAHAETLRPSAFAQLAWFFLWEVAQFMDCRGLRFTGLVVLFFVFLYSLYCGCRCCEGVSFAGLFIPTLFVCSDRFYQVSSRLTTNVFNSSVSCFSPSVTVMRGPTAWSTAVPPFTL